MKVAITGAHGLLGSALIPYLQSQGHSVFAFKRDKSGVYSFSLEQLEGLDVIVNLAGESIDSRWTAAKKKQILESRVKTSQMLSSTIAQLKIPPKLILNASAIGYYGDSGETLMDESSPKGEGFLSDVVDAWEKALKVPKARVVYMRFGVILSPNGGALKKSLLPFQLCLGGNFGAGKQWMSFIAIEDVLGAISYVIANDQIKGCVNVVTPNPIRNEEYTKALADVLKRPAVMPIPAFMLKFLFGEMGDSLLLASTRVYPKKLLESGYVYQFPTIESVLQHQLG